MDHRARVLIAEGDAATRDTLSGVLQGTGVTVILAGNGREALSLFYREHPDTVVLALELPELGGWEVLATIRELSDVPVLILADHDRKTEKVRALGAPEPPWPRPCSLTISSRSTTCDTRSRHSAQRSC